MTRPTVPEAGSQPVDEADLMCPNCCTPWKCNGPHLIDETPYARRTPPSSPRAGEARTADDVLNEDYTYVEPKFAHAFREGWKAREAESGRAGEAEGGVRPDRLRAEFVRLLTVDGGTQDRRRRDYNQAIFMPEGDAVWSSTDLDMVMDKFDRAVRAALASPEPDAEPSRP